MRSWRKTIPSVQRLLLYKPRFYDALIFFNPRAEDYPLRQQGPTGHTPAPHPPSSCFHLSMMREEGIQVNEQSQFFCSSSNSARDALENRGCSHSYILLEETVMSPAGLQTAERGAGLDEAGCCISAVYGTSFFGDPLSLSCRTQSTFFFQATGVYVVNWGHLWSLSHAMRRQTTY